MGILALVSHVALHLVVEGAPDCLEVEHVEVGILLHLVQQVDRQLVLVVGKRTEVSKVTGVHVVRPLVAELGLVLLRVVEGLHAVVGLGTRVTQGTLARLSVLAHLA